LKQKRKPMKRPPFGITIPVIYSRVRDGDTIEVKMAHSGFIFAVRLLDCWCPPKNTKDGAKATAVADKLLQRANPVDLALYIPFNGTLHPFEHLTFDRVLAHVFISEDRTLGEALIEKGLASSKKGGTLGE